MQRKYFTASNFPFQETRVKMALYLIHNDTPTLILSQKNKCKTSFYVQYYQYTYIGNLKC